MIQTMKMMMKTTRMTMKMMMKTTRMMTMKMMKTTRMMTMKMMMKTTRMMSLRMSFLRMKKKKEKRSQRLLFIFQPILISQQIE